MRLAVKTAHACSTAAELRCAKQQIDSAGLSHAAAASTASAWLPHTLRVKSSRQIIQQEGTLNAACLTPSRCHVQHAVLGLGESCRWAHPAVHNWLAWCALNSCKSAQHSWRQEHRCWFKLCTVLQMRAPQAGWHTRHRGGCSERGLQGRITEKHTYHQRTTHINWFPPCMHNARAQLRPPQ